MGMKYSEKELELMTFACNVCLAKTKEEHPNMIGCAWKCIDNEYCPEIINEMNELKKVTKRSNSNGKI